MPPPPPPAHPSCPAAAELSGLAITMADFEEAIGKVQPSVRREGFATTPDVTWDDVGSLVEASGPWLGVCRMREGKGCVGVVGGGWGGVGGGAPVLAIGSGALRLF
jgi:hypothetical protein